MMMMDASKDEESTNVECPSVFIECVPAKPIGWRLLGALRNLPRFTVTLPLRAWEWFQSMTLVTFCTILFLLATYVMASLSFFDVKSVCMSTSKVLRLHQGYKHPLGFVMLAFSIFPMLYTCLVGPKGGKNIWLCTANTCGGCMGGW